MSVCLSVCLCLFAGLTAARINLIFGMHTLIWSDCAIGYIILTSNPFFPQNSQKSILRRPPLRGLSGLSTFNPKYHIFASCDHSFCSTKKIFYVWVYPNMTFITIAKYFHWGPSVVVTVELISQKLAVGFYILRAH